jgi:alkanesulfonate monooxygenase SsuD/methylene tetrahydromethanopterin reductase-like flavin-dependent oxidoreductase (luciferase family)
MRFGLILDGGRQPGRPRQAAFKELLERAARAKRWGFHSLWTGPGYLSDGWHSTVLLARIAAEAPDMELGIVGLLPVAGVGGS